APCPAAAPATPASPSSAIPTASSSSSCRSWAAEPIVELTHLGHACLLVDTGAARLLIDPGVLSDVGDPRGLDTVLVTHQHPDHIDPEVVRRVLAANPAARPVVDAATATTPDGLPPHA